MGAAADTPRLLPAVQRDQVSSLVQVAEHTPLRHLPKQAGPQTIISRLMELLTHRDPLMQDMDLPSRPQRREPIEPLGVEFAAADHYVRA